jgi:hypothetical protein
MVLQPEIVKSPLMVLGPARTRTLRQHRLPRATSKSRAARDATLTGAIGGVMAGRGAPHRDAGGARGPAARAAAPRLHQRSAPFPQAKTLSAVRHTLVLQYRTANRNSRCVS